MVIIFNFRGRIMSGNGLTEPWQIALYRMKVSIKSIEMEIKGLKRRGRSAYVLAKEEYGLKGNRETVLEKLNALYEAERRMWK